MTYHEPQVVELRKALNLIEGDLGKPFLLYLDFRPIRPPAMTPGAYEGDE